jgi:5-methylcytosine-specific restriction endonuclease McrA
MPKGVYDRRTSVAAMAHLTRLAGKKRGTKESLITRQKKSLARLGPLNPLWGRGHTQESRHKMSQVRRGNKMGAQNSNWRGGVTRLAHCIRTNVYYQEWRQAIFERDNYTCQLCNKRGGDLNVDHFPKTFAEILKEFSIKSIEDAIACEALWDTENNRTLCVACHRGGDVAKTHI